MTNHEQLIEAFQSQNIDKAREILKVEENIPDNLESLSRVPLFDILLRARAYDIINLFIEKGLIETDIYEYENLERSFFEALLRTLSNDQESVMILTELMPKLRNLNDAVNDKTLLSLAFEKKSDPAIIKILIEGGCNVATVNNAENTYLHQIANNYIPEANLVKQYAQLLIDSGADVNASNIVADTPLMLAVSRAKIELAELLLENGARANEQNKEGKTPYYLATVDQQSLPFYELLRKYEAPDFEVKTRDGVAFFFEFLNRAGSASPSVNGLIIAMIEDGADLFQTSLHYNAEKTAFDVLAEKPFEIFELVLKATGLDIAHTDNNGNTLLHKVAAYNVNYDQNAARDTYKKTKMLLEMGADANVGNNSDETPVMLASADNLKSKTVELLLQYSK